MGNYKSVREYSVNKKLKSVKIMDEKFTLDLLPVDKTALIYSVDCKENLKNRIFDLGIVKNAEITPIYKSPFGDPTAYLIKNAVIALRKSDCQNIYVAPK